MENRFLEMDNYLKQIAGDGKRSAPDGLMRRDPELAGASSFFSRPQSALTLNRVLVILIENGGVDLGIPALVEALLTSIPGLTLVPETSRKKLVGFLKEKIKSFTDNLLEGVELSANRYTAAKPDLFGDVVILRDGTSSYAQLKNTLLALTRENKIIDLFILTHGRNNFISVPGGIDAQKIRDMRTENGKPLQLRSVYMMNCVGASLNQAWIDAGAKVSAGSLKNNYLPEPTMFFFWQNWKEGQSFENAVTAAYRKTINLMKSTVQLALRELPIPGAEALATQLDFENMEFVRDSAPVIQGQRSITIFSDDLSFTQTISSSLATTVLPVSLLSSFSFSRSDSIAPGQPGSISPQGVDFIKTWEAFRDKLYNDAAGNCTIGYGSLVHAGNCDGRESEKPYASGISEAQATQLLMQKLAEIQRVINSNVRVALNRNQFDALASFVYNIGTSGFQKSTLLRLLNEGQTGAVPGELKKWTKAYQNEKLVDLPGLVRRRAAEAGLFQKAVTAEDSPQVGMQKSVPGSNSNGYHQRTNIAAQQSSPETAAPAEDKDVKDLKDKVGKLVTEKFGGSYRKGFDYYDGNHDGAIEAAELTRLLADADVGNVFTRGRWVAGIIEKMDTNHDGKIQWAEFESAIK
jgi:GH24 family phage-related lysozyme (muramidase)